MKIGVTVHREGNWFVAAEPITGVTSQGKTCDEALKNFQEAFELWFECAEEWGERFSFEGRAHCNNGSRHSRLAFTG